MVMEDVSDTGANRVSSKLIRLLVSKMIFLLKEARTQRDLTQRALSKRSGVLQGFISEIEAGNEKPSLETAYRLAHALGVKVDDLIQPEGQSDVTNHDEL